MHWAWPLVTLGFLLSFTTVFYFFSTPASIAVKPTADSTLPPYWGVVDSEFNWCESDHVLFTHVAEPFNTCTSAAYPFAASFAWRTHRPLGLSGWHLGMLIVTVVMGVGSMVFHGTLRYPAQLLDELPLYTMAVLAAGSLHTRSRRAAGIQPWLGAWTLVLTSVLLLTDREAPLHNVFRGIMTVTFSLAFLFIFTVGSVAANEVDASRGGNDGTSMFRACLFSFVVALGSWIVDIVACHELQQLPFSLPYPQLHAFGWHFGTCLGLLQLFALMVLHQHTVRDGREARVEWNSIYVPRVRIAEKGC